MIGWARARRQAWQARRQLEQVEVSTRWTLVALPWMMFAAGVPQALLGISEGPLPVALSCGVVVLGTTSCVVSATTMRPAVDAYLGGAPVSRLRLATLTGLTVAVTGLLLTLVAVDGTGQEPAVMALFGAVSPFLAPFALLVSVATTARTLAVLDAGLVIALVVVGVRGQALVAAGVVLAVGGMCVIASSRCSAWYIAVMRELDEARDVQARLAVAEERLRFARDLHDVIGRNLSVIALKSELASQLARRGSESSVDQMVEVQRIAREAQREVRDVVRGYREADLRTELAGARAVLRAAGIDCRTDTGGTVTGTAGAPDLPEPVRSALGWVVREGTTNVLRHADASYCLVTLRVSRRPDETARRGEAVLTMENDGAGARPEPPGSGDTGGTGLAGLRERLAAVGGTLGTERVDGTYFRLTARVPLGAATGAGNTAGSSGAGEAGLTGPAAEGGPRIPPVDGGRTGGEER